MRRIRNMQMFDSSGGHARFFTVTAIALMTVCISLVGCKRQPQQGAASFKAVPVCAPFDSLGLSTAGGVVRSCTPTTMYVIYDGGDKAAYGDKYQSAATKAGWVPRIPPDIGPRQWMRIYDKDKKTLNIVVKDEDHGGRVPGGIQVLLTIDNTIK